MARPTKGFVETPPVAPPSRHDEAADYDAVPLDAAQAARTAPPPTLDPSPPFLLTHHAHRWTVMGGKVIPCFARIPMMRGVNGVTQDRTTGQWRYGDAKIAAEQAHRRIIPTDAVPPHHLRPGEAPSYLVKPKGTAAHVLRYVRTFPGDSVTEVDVPRYVEWCEWLVANGYVDPCPMHELRKMLTRAEKARDAAADKAQKVPSAAGMVKHHQAVVDAIEAEISRREEEARASVTPSESDSVAL